GSWQGTRTFTMFAANGSQAVPPGLSMSGTNGCFLGSVTAFGDYTFTVQVEDQASPHQIATQVLSLHVALAVDQSAGGSNPSGVVLNFGGGPRLGQRFTAGVAGFLSAIRVFGLSCPAGTSVTADIQGVEANGGPNGITIASGTGVTPFNYISLTTLLQFAADEQFTMVLSANNSCGVQPQTFDVLAGGEAYVSASPWQKLRDTADGRYDLPVQTLVVPAQGLGIMAAWRGSHTATTLADGVHVLIVGGGGNISAEIYDSSTGTSVPIGAPNVPRQNHTATLLANGDVLIVGGTYFDSGLNATAYSSSAELWHHDTNAFELLSATMSTPRAYHTATRLGDGRVLIAGGQSG